MPPITREPGRRRGLRSEDPTLFEEYNFEFPGEEDRFVGGGGGGGASIQRQRLDGIQAARMDVPPPPPPGRNRNRGRKEESFFVPFLVFDRIFVFYFSRSLPGLQAGAVG